MRTQLSATQQHICPNAKAVTLSMIYNTHLQQRTHTGGENGRFCDFQKNKNAAGSEVEPTISEKSHYGPDSVEGRVLVHLRPAQGPRASQLTSLRLSFTCHSITGRFGFLRSSPRMIAAWAGRKP